MNPRIPDLLLVLATATAALSAASARRPWREVPVHPGIDTEEYLAFDLALAPTIEASRGRRLDADLTTQLDKLGIHTVRIRVPAQPVVEVSLDDALGEVLAAPVVLHGETETLRAGRLVGEALTARALEAGVVLPTSGQGDNTRLSETVDLPARLRTSTFLDDATMTRLREAGISTVAVKRVAPFTWAHWAGRWAFLLSVCVMLVAVLLKRAARAAPAEGADESADLETLRRELADLAAGAQELADRADSLEAADIHAGLDPLIDGPAYAFVEGRETLQQSAGMAGYALVMDPFSRGERQLARAWSASVDGHAEEARASLKRAAPLLLAATDAFPS